MNQQSLSSFIWSIADLLRGAYKRADFGKVILPFTVLRRLDLVLADTREDVLAEKATWEGKNMDADAFMRRASRFGFYNASKLDLQGILGDPSNIASNLHSYIDAFSPEVRDIFEKFEFHAQVDKLEEKDLIFQVLERFLDPRVDLHPDNLTSAQMGDAFEELIRKFAEDSNETAGEHFTPRDVIRLMAELVFIEDDAVLGGKEGLIRRIYDPTVGTGGMLSVADEFLRDGNYGVQLVMSGQELNAESYAICKADMLIKGQDVNNIVYGNTLSDDGHEGQTFDYMLANPPFGVDWKGIRRSVEKEHKEQGYAGRFGPGTPRVSDGSLLFLLHMLSKMQPEADGGCRFGIVLNGSPLFTGGAGGGESEIRRYLLENDLVEAIVALPTDMFFNTGIATYVWVVSNRKPKARKGKTQLIDGSTFFRKMRKSLGSKRREIGEKDREALVKLFGDGEPMDIVTLLNADDKEIDRSIIAPDAPTPEAPEGGKAKRAPVSLVLTNEAFGYHQITVERPLLNEYGERVLVTRGKNKGEPQPDTALRDTETVPLTNDISEYVEREVLPHVPDAWIDESKTKLGYEIPFNRHFYVFEPPRQLSEIDAELADVTADIQTMLREMAA
ncbi:type I restriction-modification system subunit M [Pacificimonas flava]|uniref:site-specific DNA-methyltransferase (adenine-specific) n=1 Tax=Pacificimonas flava TaxID=1234595 RepID=M2U1P4_9SPHN|nr:class I SAM-dependent DNA methyltransferase [Pacificimonas flava]EMD81897.1 Type I restriction-modification system, DNA-methyltransferase subunit M [Pacificimonas flava]MBB5281573.1 type I restriction enzyme M protein [Pacificimonas flava]